MNKVKIEDVCNITFQKYEQHWQGFIFGKDCLLNGEECTDDNWNPLPEYSDAVWVSAINDEPVDNAIMVRERDIFLEAFQKTVLYSGWGCHNPVVGPGLADCGEPDFCFDDVDGEHRYLVTW